MNDVRPASQARHWAELDVLRFLSAVLVMFFHYASTDTQGSRQHVQYGDVYGFAAWDLPARLGALGVDLFFFISGFVIAFSANGMRPAAFMASRFTRLMPTYWLAVLLTSAGILWAGEGYRTIGWQQLFGNLLCMQRLFKVEFIDGVYWSLLVEMRFYALVLLLLLFRQFHNYPRWLGLWAALAALDTLGMPLGFLRQALLLSYAPWFIVGGAAYLMTLGYRRWSWALLAGMLPLIVARQVDKYGQHGSLDAALAAAAVCIMALCVMAVPAGHMHGLRMRWAAPLAAATYPLYLLHEDLGFVLMRHIWLGNAAWTLSAVALCAMGLAWVVVKGFEAPLLPPLRQWLMLRLDRHPLLSRAGPPIIGLTGIRGSCGE